MLEKNSNNMKRSRPKILVFLEGSMPAPTRHRMGEASKSNRSSSDLEQLYARETRIHSNSRPAPNSPSTHANQNSDSSTSYRKLHTDSAAEKSSNKIRFPKRGSSKPPLSSETRPRNKVSAQNLKLPSYHYSPPRWEYSVGDQAVNQDGFSITLHFEIAPECGGFDVQTEGGCLSAPLQPPPPPPNMPPPIPPRLSTLMSQTSAAVITPEPIIGESTNYLSSYGGYATSNCFGSNGFNQNNGANVSNCFGSNGLSDYYTRKSIEQNQQNSNVSFLGSYGTPMNCGSQSFGSAQLNNNVSNNIGSYGIDAFNNNAYNYGYYTDDYKNSSLGYYTGYNTNNASNALCNYNGYYSSCPMMTLNDYMGFNSPSSLGGFNYAAATSANNVYPYYYNTPYQNTYANYSQASPACNYSAYTNQTSIPPVYNQSYGTNGYSAMNLGTYNYLGSLNNGTNAQVNPFNSASFQSSPSFTSLFDTSVPIKPLDKYLVDQIINGGCEAALQNTYGPYNVSITVPYGTGNIFVNELLKRRYNNDQFYGGFYFGNQSGYCHCCCSPRPQRSLGGGMPNVWQKTQRTAYKTRTKKNNGVGTTKSNVYENYPMTT